MSPLSQEQVEKEQIQNPSCRLGVENWHGRLLLGATDAYARAPNIYVDWTCSWKDLLSVNVVPIESGSSSRPSASLDIHLKRPLPGRSELVKQKEGYIEKVAFAVHLGSI